ncbi:MAG: glycosyltransferase family 4 protein, partial [Nitrososphaera sp.]
AKGLKLQGCDITIVSAFPHYPHGKIPKEYRGRLITVESVEGMRIIRTTVPPLSHSSVSKRILMHMSFMLSSLLGAFYVRRFDIIIAMNPNFFSFFPALIYGVIFRKKIIRNVDDLWPEVFYDLGIVRNRIAKRILDSLSRISYQIPVAIIPVSKGYLRILKDKYKIFPEKITIIEHGVDVTRFHRTVRAESPAKTKKIIMYSGAITQGYDFETVIKAAHLINDERIQFIIRGTGDSIVEVQELMKKHEVRNVELRTELLPQDELVALLNSADIFLLPMSSVGVIDEGLPTKILEYQALGKPIVCLSTGEAGRYISATRSGIIVPRDPGALAEAILKLANDENLARTLGQNALSNVQGNLTLDIIGMRLLNVIENSLRKSIT